ncbi:MAG: hypothetical protein A3F10_03015 [Coxiella sp. RIFCSPHIGHO2_12_FULL_42_15]|nr:MAG: hypothetical protein A3F10_03015 [Coxiella sp. RIFCSPHIGHO2_12_FULL_42_15]
MSLLSPQIQAFVYIAKCGTVHQAATALHLTQTAVTQRLRLLEQKLGVSLFVRSRRGMLLTAEGETLLRYCHACLDLEHETLSEIKASGVTQSVEIKISGPTSFMGSRVIRQCFSVLQAFPRLLVHFDITDDEHRHLQLREGQAHLAIIQPEHLAAEMESKTLQPEQYVLVCSSAWRHRELKEIIQREPIIDYAPDDQMTFNYLKRYRLFDDCNHQRHFVNRTESLAWMIAEKLGYGLLTKEFSQPYLDNNKLIILNDHKIYENHLCLAWYPRPHLPNYLWALIEAIA